MDKDTLELTTTWAVPVKAEKLGAHLEAYKIMLPTFSALRLCNRFGEGQQVFINKLPNEIISEIEKHLVRDERDHALIKWGRRLLCLEGEHECFHVSDVLAHHFTAEELDAFLDPYAPCPCSLFDDTDVYPGDDQCECEQCIWKWPSDYMYQDLLENYGALVEKHRQIRRETQFKVFSGKLFNDTVRDKGHEGPEAKEAVLTYLILPNAYKQSNSIEPYQEETETGRIGLQQSLVHEWNPARIEAQQPQRRFCRALTNLGLTPYRSLHRKCIGRPTSTIANRSATKVVKPWPRIMSLAKATELSDF